MTNDAETFPPDCDVEFIGEGAANVVFHVKFPDGQPVFPGRLLRVPKAGTSAFSYEELQHYWQTTVAPLFRTDQLVQQSLIRLAGSGIAAKLNALLARSDATRRRDFQGSRVADADHGMLVEDMRKQTPTDAVLEFKPKWLAQSPRAPASATRCRTCAREAYRAAKDGSLLGRGPLAAKPAAPPFCPLRLVHARTTPCVHRADDGDPACEFCAAVTSLLVLLCGGDAEDPTLGPGRRRRLLARWLRTDELLPRLRRLQVEDGDGEEDGSADQGGRLERAMTLRDCTCFVRLRGGSGDGEGGRVEAKLGDLDRKNGAAKRPYWEEMERRLVVGGFYEGREVPRQETACWLERLS